MTGRPLLRRGALPASTERSSVLRSPYVRDLVYQLQHTRGFGRVTMAALHAGRRVVLPRRLAPHRAQSTRRPDIVHAHALHQAAARVRRSADSDDHQPARDAPHPRYIADLRLPMRSSPTAGPRNICRPRSDGPSSTCRRAWTPTRSAPMVRTARERWALTGSASSRRQPARADQERRACSSTRWALVRARAPRRAAR